MTRMKYATAYSRCAVNNQRKLIGFFSTSTLVFPEVLSENGWIETHSMSFGANGDYEDVKLNEMYDFS